MADFLKVIGVIVFVVAGGALALAFNVGGSGAWVSLVTFLPAFIGGAAIYGLGEIMNNVAAIRRASERTAAATEEMMRHTTAKPR